MAARASERIILGIDPGTLVTGYGIIAHQGKSMRLVACGVITLGRTQLDQPQKLKRIYDRILSLLEAYLPDEMAIEAPFYSVNVQSTIKLGRAQGVAMAAAMARSVPIVEYAPTQVKRSVTGRGTASKDQVAGMMAAILPELKTQPERILRDATDALAVAMCHYLSTNALLPTAKTSLKKSTTKKSRKSAWAAYANANPKRVG